MDGNKQRQPETVYSFWLPFFGAKRCACLPCFAASYDASMDKELNPLTGDYTGRAVKNLQNAVYIRLRTPLGTWWADKSIGSLLHLLQREKDVARVGLLDRGVAVRRCDTFPGLDQSFWRLAVRDMDAVQHLLEEYRQVVKE